MESNMSPSFAVYCLRNSRSEFLWTLVLYVFLLIISLHVSSTVGNLDKQTAETIAHISLGEKRLGEHIRAILKHYQQENPIGLPGVPIPDPMPVPDMKHSFSIYTMNLKQINVYGLSKFRIQHIESELALMQVTVAVSIDSLDIRGIYTLGSWLSRSAGDFTVKLTGVNVEGIARLEVASDGKLQAQDIGMDLTFEKIDMDFKNLGFLGSVFQSVINSVGTFIFDSIKPFILKEVNTNMRGEANKQISQLPQYFPNSISPFDMAIAEARRQVSRMGYDPFRVKDYGQSVGVFSVMSTHTWITGLASFYRMGNVTLSMQNGTVYAVLDVGTQSIEGKTQWEVSMIGGILSRAGTLSFAIRYFRIRANLSQPLDTRKRPMLEELDLELGNIQTRVHGAGTFDYLVEATVNALPNLLRYQIMDAIEGPLKRRLQEELNKVDVEKLIHDRIPDIEERAKTIQRTVPQEGTVFSDNVHTEDGRLSTTDTHYEDRFSFSESEEERGPS